MISLNATKNVGDEVWMLKITSPVKLSIDGELYTTEGYEHVTIPVKDIDSVHRVSITYVVSNYVNGKNEVISIEEYSNLLKERGLSSDTIDETLSNLSVDDALFLRDYKPNYETCVTPHYGEFKVIKILCDERLAEKGLKIVNAVVNDTVWYELDEIKFVYETYNEFFARLGFTYVPDVELLHSERVKVYGYGSSRLVLEPKNLIAFGTYPFRMVYYSDKKRGSYDELILRMDMLKNEVESELTRLNLLVFGNVSKMLEKQVKHIVPEVLSIKEQYGRLSVYKKDENSYNRLKKQIDVLTINILKLLTHEEE